LAFSFASCAATLFLSPGAAWSARSLLRNP
jgi:hypothetical protein